MALFFVFIFWVLSLIFSLPDYIKNNPKTPDNTFHPRDDTFQQSQNTLYPLDLNLEYLLVWGIYAYYVKQGKAAHPFPYQDAVRHARLQLMRHGYRTSTTNCYSFKDITPQIENDLNFLEHYTADSESNLPYFSELDGRREADVWPFKCVKYGDTNTLLGPHVFYWSKQAFPIVPIQCRDLIKWDRTSYFNAFLFNRMTEWYYLVMFRCEYLSLHLDINEVLYDERSCPAEFLPDEDDITIRWNWILSEIQDAVKWGSIWDESIHARQWQGYYDSQSAQNTVCNTTCQVVVDTSKVVTRADEEAIFQSYSSPVDSATAEWARQQLKEKYGIDYRGEVFH